MRTKDKEKKKKKREFVSSPEKMEIDPNQLDKEWLEQPNKYLYYSKLLADARESLEKAREQASIAEAEATKQIRSNPEEYEIVKGTEAEIRAAVIQHPDVLLANRKVIKASHEVQIIEAHVRALDHRKKALENLVTLFLHGYYSDPRRKLTYKNLNGVQDG